MPSSSSRSPGRVFLNLSGGVDSVYAAWWWLQNRPEGLVIHHCHLKNSERRDRAEAEAVKSVLAWLREHKLDRFEFIESTFDYGTIPHLVWDIEIIGFLTGLVLRGSRYKDITRVLMTTTADDLRLRSSDKRRARREQLAQIMLPRRQLEAVWVNRHLSKAQMVKAMPKDLLALTWSCRKPQNGKPCRTCYTCKLLLGYR